MSTFARGLLVVALAVAVVGFYSRHHHPAQVATPAAVTDDSSGPTNVETAENAPAPADTFDSKPEPSDSRQTPFRCDGRTYCSQMTSCAEAKYFLAHCPNVRMDGDHDGIPCERQWCPNG